LLSVKPGLEAIFIVENMDFIDSLSAKEKSLVLHAVWKMNVEERLFISASKGNNMVYTPYNSHLFIFPLLKVSYPNFSE